MGMFYTTNKGGASLSMKNITINIPEAYDVQIQKLIRAKIVPSRSEAIRIALREFLHSEFKFFTEILGGELKC